MPVTQEERAALALAALAEVTDRDDVGELLAVEEVEPGVVDVRFACTLAAYAGWHWTVSTADLPDQEPTVLEVEMVPGEGALLAPPWVPWAERLAEWRRQHPDEHHPGEESDEADDDLELEQDDEVDLDEDDLVVDDGLDELDDADLDGEASAEDAGVVSDEDDDADATDDEDQDQDGPRATVRPASDDRPL